MKQAFETIKQLVEDFKEQETAYLSPSYQESQIRQDFIDKFFTALGWDVTHTIQKNPYQQEVHIENKVHMAGSQRRADYAFFCAPNFRDPKFFVEAKKPSRNLANPDDYYQTIRYGWNANTPIAILTDFEEFHILDCRYKPNIKDVMSHKIEYFHYIDYANEEKFSRIYWLFSREAVAGGSIEKRAAELPQPRAKGVQRGYFKGGYQPVDEAFLEELDGYREVLAKAFKKSNPDLQSEELTEAVQRTIDRLVFIRFLEDKQIEEPEIINLRSKKSAWNGFLALSKKFDPKYNGLVFKPHRILDGKEFNPPDDEEFVHICDELSDPGSPYNFDQIPVSILGSIYERFLGKVVHATDKRVKVEEKPEVRKAGGVYYTPEYIVRYIVNETVGKLLYNNNSVIVRNDDPQSLRRSEAPKGQATEAIRQTKEEEIASQKTLAMTKNEGEAVRNDEFRRTPEQVAQMAFADIACGSGSFLIEVYNVLLDYHIRYYLEHPEKQKEADVFERDGKLHLTLQKKKEILQNNIYGVDIDFQATEVTQLSLYLKLLEDVTMHDTHQFGMFKETILPDLRKNIINGNSLIGRDIAESSLFPDVNVEKLKPMNFEDAFPAVMKRGGFDAVVGNPPYVRQEELGVIFKNYVSREYKVFTGTADLYVYFIEKSNRILSKKNGAYGIICSNKFMRSNYGASLRLFISENYTIQKIIDFGELPVFQGASTFPAIYILRSKNIQDQKIYYAPIKRLSFSNLNEEISTAEYEIQQTELQENGWTLVRNNEAQLLKKISLVKTTLGDYVGKNIFRGVLTGLNEAFVIDEKTKNRLVRTDSKSSEIIKRFCLGDDIRKYKIYFRDRYLIFTRRGLDIERYPAIKKYLEGYKERLKPKPKNWSRENWQGRKPGIYKWYEIQDSIDYYTAFEKPKIVFPDIAKESRIAFDTTGIFVANTAYIIPLNDLYLLGLLNSKLIFHFYKRIATVLGDADKGGRLRWIYQDVVKIPIYKINFEDTQDKSRHDAIVKLVEQMLDAKEKLSAAKTESEINRFESLCQTLDRQIDETVYDLYGLTEEEIKIVEGK